MLALAGLEITREMLYKQLIQGPNAARNLQGHHAISRFVRSPFRAQSTRPRSFTEDMAKLGPNS